MKFGHYSNEELGIRRNLTCAMFENKGVSVEGDKKCALKTETLQMDYQDPVSSVVGWVCKNYPAIHNLKKAALALRDKTRLATVEDYDKYVTLSGKYIEALRKGIEVLRRKVDRDEIMPSNEALLKKGLDEAYASQLKRMSDLTKSSKGRWLKERQMSNELDKAEDVQCATNNAYDDAMDDICQDLRRSFNKNFRNIDEAIRYMYKDLITDTDWTEMFRNRTVTEDMILDFCFANGSSRAYDEKYTCERLTIDGYSMAEAKKATSKAYKDFEQKCKPYAKKVFALYKKLQNERQMSNELDELKCANKDAEQVHAWFKQRSGKGKQLSPSEARKAFNAVKSNPAARKYLDIPEIEKWNAVEDSGDNFVYALLKAIKSSGEQLTRDEEWFIRSYESNLETAYGDSMAGDPKKRNMSNELDESDGLNVQCFTVQELAREKDKEAAVYKVADAFEHDDPGEFLDDIKTEKELAKAQLKYERDSKKIYEIAIRNCQELQKAADAEGSSRSKEHWVWREKELKKLYVRFQKFTQRAYKEKLAELKAAQSKSMSNELDGASDVECGVKTHGSGRPNPKRTWHTAQRSFDTADPGTLKQFQREYAKLKALTEKCKQARRLNRDVEKAELAVSEQAHHCEQIALKLKGINDAAYFAIRDLEQQAGTYGQAKYTLGRAIRRGKGTATEQELKEDERRRKLREEEKRNRYKLRETK